MRENVSVCINKVPPARVQITMSNRDVQENREARWGCLVKRDSIQSKPYLVFEMSKLAHLNSNALFRVLRIQWYPSILIRCSIRGERDSIDVTKNGSPSSPYGVQRHQYCTLSSHAHISRVMKMSLFGLCKKKLVLSRLWADPYLASELPTHQTPARLYNKPNQCITVVTRHIMNKRYVFIVWKRLIGDSNARGTLHSLLGMKNWESSCVKTACRCCALIP
jgi:hypothetical protein